MVAAGVGTCAAILLAVALAILGDHGADPVALQPPGTETPGPAVGAESYERREAAAAASPVQAQGVDAATRSIPVEFAGANVELEVLCRLDASCTTCRQIEVEARRDAVVQRVSGFQPDITGNIQLPAGTWELRAVAAPACASPWLTVQVRDLGNAPAPIALELHEFHGVEVRVVANDRTVLADFPVTLRMLDEPDATGTPRVVVAVTDAHGRLEHYGAKPTSLQVHAGLPAHPAGPTLDLRLEAAGRYQTIDLAAAAPLDVELQLIPAVAGEMSGSLVTMTPIGSGAPRRTAILDRLGHARFDRMAPGAWEVAATTPAGYCIGHRVDIQPQTREIEVPLEKQK